MTRVFFDISLSLDGFEAASNRRPDKSKQFQCRETRPGARAKAAPSADGLRIPLFLAKKGRRGNAGAPPVHFGSSARTDKPRDHSAAYPR